jgi:hypothetical protein
MRTKLAIISIFLGALALPLQAGDIDGKAVVGGGLGGATGAAVVGSAVGGREGAIIGWGVRSARRSPRMTQKLRIKLQKKRSGRCAKYITTTTGDTTAACTLDTISGALRNGSKKPGLNPLRGFLDGANRWTCTSLCLTPSAKLCALGRDEMTAGSL